MDYKFLFFFFVIIEIFEAKLVNYKLNKENVFHKMQPITTLKEDIKRRDSYTVLKKFVHNDRLEAVRNWSTNFGQWESYYLSPYPIWIEQPTDWDKPNANITKMTEYNARMYWRYHSLMRHKATISPSCWRRNTSIYTSMTIIQIYHEPGEPYKIPCYICQKRFERDGRPKVFYYVEDRNIFDFQVNFTADNFTKQFYSDKSNKIKRVLDYAHKEMTKINNQLKKYDFAVPWAPDIKSVGIEWQMDQTYGDNVINKGGDGLYVNPSLNSSLKLPNYGTFFCMNERPGPKEMPEVIVNVDVLTKTKTLAMVTEDEMVSDIPPTPLEHINENYECLVFWEQWSCPAVCDPRRTEQYQIFRKGYSVVRKLNPYEPLKPTGERYIGSSGTWRQWRAVDAYMSTSPYRENGIPLYSSFWFSFELQSQYFYNNCAPFVKSLTYIDSTTERFDCKKKVQCENNAQKSQIFTLVDDSSSETLRGGDGGGDGGGGGGGGGDDDDTWPDNHDYSDRDGKSCPLDIVKHEIKTVPRVDQRKSHVETLEHLKYYEFICVDNMETGITWKNGSKTLKFDCNQGDQFVRRDRLHIHRPMDGSTLSLICSDKKHKLGEMKVVFKKPVDWRMTIVTSVVVSSIIFLSCPLCMCCSRGVRDITKTAFDYAKKAAIIAIDMKTGGMAGHAIGGMDEKEKQKKEEKRQKKEALLEQRIQNQLAQKRVRRGEF